MARPHRQNGLPGLPRTLPGQGQCVCRPLRRLDERSGAARRARRCAETGGGVLPPEKLRYLEVRLQVRGPRRRRANHLPAAQGARRDATEKDLALGAAGRGGRAERGVRRQDVLRRRGRAERRRHDRLPRGRGRGRARPRPLPVVPLLHGLRRRRAGAARARGRPRLDRRALAAGTRRGGGGGEGAAARAGAAEAAAAAADARGAEAGRGEDREERRHEEG
mmetsp:Transcript_4495/g.12797  ORF Transcript_4495/g.12797 Transcript_4495/m.12797 type:complete len:221 (+) Transcript_4495:892-1554(+)